jgi:copper chaperone
MKPQRQTLLEVTGMTCPSCVRRVDRALRQVPGVSSVDVRLQDGEALIEHDGTASLASLVSAIDEAGYEARPSASSAAPQRIDIAVTEDGFSPGQIAVKAGVPVILAFTRLVALTCAKHVHIELGDGITIQRGLPIGETVLIPATFAGRGRLAYGCPVDMITGVIEVE